MASVAKRGARGDIVRIVVLAIALGSVCGVGHAADIDPSAAVPDFQVRRMPFGSGTPAPDVTNGTETALPVADGLYHVPNYLPGFPTAATIWPRELPLDCEPDADSGKPSCSGFEVYPATGRGEYLFVRPMLKTVPLVTVPIQQNAPAAPAPEIPVTHKKPLG